MSASRFGRWQKATALVPLALLSAAWTASLTGIGPASVSVATGSADGRLPDGSSVPTRAVEAPASVSSPEGTSGSVGGVDGDAERIVANSSTNGIPASALAAYQRAETVINAADKTCNLSWQLIAAIGRVESDHGRFGGSALDADGVAQPSILGIALDGANDTAEIRDTDAGELDDDTAFDRAVGPMQFIPSTWAVVGVDADNDGVRNPQDIDDAALGTAVYLCSGSDDLATLAGQRAAIYRYNNSQAYVDLVLSIMDAYLGGDFTSVPDGTTAAGFLTPDPRPDDGDGGNGDGDGNRGDGPRGGGDGGDTAGEAAPPPPAPTGPTEPSEPPESGDGNDGGDDGGGPATGGGNNGGGPVTGGGGGAPDPPDVPDVPDTGVPPVDDTVTRVEALAQCTLDGVINLPLTPENELETCIQDLLAP